MKITTDTVQALGAEPLKAKTKYIRCGKTKKLLAAEKRYLGAGLVISPLVVVDILSL